MLGVVLTTWTYQVSMGTIFYYVLVLIPILWFIIRVSSVLVIFFMELHDSIINKSSLEAHAFLLDLFVFL